MANPIRIQCAVTSVVNHDGTVSTVTLQPARRLPNFKPGQFLHLALDAYDPTIGYWPESRVFSIASSPLDPEVTIAYAVKGAFTQRMREELTVGKEIWVRLPYGHFTLATSAAEEIVLVAGGTGITPFISFILQEMHSPSGMPLTLLYGVRKPELFLFQSILTQAMARLEGFKLLAFSEEISDEPSEFSACAGCLSLDAVWQAAGDPVNATFYLAGPTGMISAFKAGLIGRGVNPEKIRIDDWE